MTNSEASDFAHVLGDVLFEDATVSAPKLGLRLCDCDLEAAHCFARFWC